MKNILKTLLSGKQLILMLFCAFFMTATVAYGGYSVVELEPAPLTAIYDEEEVDNFEAVDAKVQGEDVVEDVVLRRVEIHLRGATEYETVQIFNRLLHEVSVVKEIERTRMVVLPNRPGRCIASWDVLTREEDTFEIERELHKLIKNLDPSGGNNVLDDLYFKVASSDIEIAKRIRPISATVDSLNFHIQLLRKKELKKEGDSSLYAGFD